jgi:hypothetical protein
MYQRYNSTKRNVEKWLIKEVGDAISILVQALWSRGKISAFDTRFRITGKFCPTCSKFVSTDIFNLKENDNFSP